MLIHMLNTEKVILFDGVCVLCSAWSRFILKYDREGIFRLAAVQSQAGKTLLAHFSMPLYHYETMLYVEGGRAYTKSDAFLKIISQLPFPWRALKILRWIPKIFRNWLYDRVARHRYALFGKHATCVVPSEKDKQRFYEDTDQLT